MNQPDSGFAENSSATPNMTPKLVLKTALKNNLPRLVREAGYPTMEIFGHEIGLKKRIIHRILKGGRLPELDTLNLICETLQISWEQLLQGANISLSHTNTQPKEIKKQPNNIKVSDPNKSSWEQININNFQNLIIPQIQRDIERLFNVHTD